VISNFIVNAQEKKNVATTGLNLLSFRCPGRSDGGVQLQQGGAHPLAVLREQRWQQQQWRGF
jgi:hypothetical protein